MGLNLDGIEKLRWGQVSFIFEERQKKTRKSQDAYIIIQI